VIKESDLLNAKLLIVDDQVANVMLLERMLKGAGYNSITSTQKPTEVCELHHQNNYDLILLDLQMPIMSGFQVMEGLSKIETGGYIPVLVITAQPEEKLRALKAGARDFVSKPFDLAEVLARVKNLLEVRLLNVETQKLYDQVLSEKKVSERLLHNVLPHSIVDRLKRRPEVMLNDFTQVVADSFPEVSVLFADIVNFTKFSEGLSPVVLVNVLNDIFTRFDAIADSRGLEKIKTIGDSYMAVAGLPLPSHNHAEGAANMAIDMQEAMKHFNEKSNHKLDIRIGISSGAAVAGVIGKKKFLYDVWGDVVNTASRMESQGIPGRIQITDTTRLKLGDQFTLEKRGPIEIRGKGPMNTWFLNSRDFS
jgi:adenylate cyclase